MSVAHSSPLPTGWPWALLRLDDAPLRELEGGPTLGKKALASMKITSWRGFFTEDPTLWVFVFEFDHQRDAIAAARGALSTAWPSGPSHVEWTVNGAWLIVTGFPPSADAPAPAALELQTAFLSAFAGEE